MTKSVIDDYYETKRKEEDRLMQLKEFMKKRKEYGNRV